MSGFSDKLGFISVICGSVALLVALVHFYAGPFAPQPSIGERVVVISNATVAALRGDEPQSKSGTSDMNIDELIGILTFSLGILALTLGIVGWTVGKKNRGVAIGGAFLGGLAVSFQFFGVALGVFALVAIVASALSLIGFG